MSEMDVDRIAAEVERDGYALVRGLYAPEAMQELRERALGFFERQGRRVSRHSLTQPGVLLKAPFLESIAFDPKVIEIVRRLTGDTEPVFTLHSDLHLNNNAYWHKDDGGDRGRGYFEIEPYARDDCRVFKFGIYLQDHEHDDRALTVRSGSHRDAAIPGPDFRTLRPRLGDAVLFDVRLSHRAWLGIRELRVSSRLGERVLNFARYKLYRRTLGQLPPAADRLAFFFTYGANDALTQAFAERNMQRQLRQDPTLAPHLEAFMARSSDLAVDCMALPALAAS